MTPLQEDMLIQTAKMLAEKWSEPIYEAVKNSCTNLQGMDKSDIDLFICVCSGLNIAHKELCPYPQGSQEWAESIVESCVIMAYISHYDYNNTPRGDKMWIDCILRARNGEFGEIPGANIKINEVEQIIPKLHLPKRENTKIRKITRCIDSDSKTYLMHDSNTGYTKIGKSVNPRQRERTLQSEKPTITLFKVCEKLVEEELHRKFRAKRIRGEWFNLTKEDIEDICNSYGFYPPK